MEIVTKEVLVITDLFTLGMTAVAVLGLLSVFGSIGWLIGVWIHRK